MQESPQTSDIRASLVKYAAFCLNRRPYFREVLHRKLIHRSQKLKFIDAEPIIDSILDDLQKSGYLDDLYLAQAFVRRQLDKCYGPKIISLKLYRLHLNKETVDAALGTEADIPKQKQSIAKFLSKNRSADKRKLITKLYARGFSSSVMNNLFDSEYIED